MAFRVFFSTQDHSRHFRPLIAAVLSQSNDNESTPMARLSAFVVIAFVLGCLATSTVSGCSKAADRTLSIYQFQSTETYDGQFNLDTSELPSDAIESTVDSGGPGDPVRRIKLNIDYEFEIVLRLVGLQSNAGRLNSGANEN